MVITTGLKYGTNQTKQEFGLSPNVELSDLTFVRKYLHYVFLNINIRGKKYW